MSLLESSGVMSPRSLWAESSPYYFRDGSWVMRTRSTLYDLYLEHLSIIPDENEKTT